MVHRCVINSVVMWLHILVRPGSCVYVALFGGRFNVAVCMLHLLVVD